MSPNSKATLNALAARRSRTRRFSLTRSLTPLLLAVVSALIVLPTTIVVVFALVPAFAALVVDEGRPRYLFRTVLGVNLAALWPYLEQLWLGGNDMAGAAAVIGDIYAWAAVYGAAGAGWLVYLSAPAVIAGWRRFSGERRIKALKDRQKALLAEWGDVLPTVEQPAAARVEEGEAAAKASS